MAKWTADVNKIRFRGGVIVQGSPGGPNVIMRVLVRGRQEGQRQCRR